MDSNSSASQQAASEGAWDCVEWDYPTPFLLDVSVEEKDIDGLQHVNNAVYVSWCQEAGWGHSKALGIGLKDYQALDRAMAIRRSEFDYLQAAYLGDSLKVATWLTGNDNKLSMERRFQLVRASDGATLLRARWDLVCIQISSGRPKRMPTSFKEVYGSVVVEA
ncbi:acyl-CoA thioesterase [Aestuariicella hydrocarbonica]|uniref:Acyl-CoA thioesterase n=1 Tax=Pseudomaricurvus hydrocarbonicus TaxID=1470433 RepID=A0A9E5K168_9GAMM|nr:thioesterase family protein [Aestuariicella hydrocarbonica]NHO66932.1 acyl-CoA thioesterase [Aestuariicella hydrocarbonica]